MRNGNVVATTTTGPDGSYTFDHLPDGAYSVRVQPGSVPAGLNATTPTALPATITNGNDVTGLNFGYDSPTGAIGDRVWFDVDGDGVQDASEAGISGVTLELLNGAGQVIATEVTNNSGTYLFDDLADGTYTVRVVAATLPAGLTNTFGGVQQAATVTNASTDLSKDFGYQPSGTISGRVFNDVDGNGTIDAGEAGHPGCDRRTGGRQRRRRRHDPHRPRRHLHVRPPPRRRVLRARAAGLGPGGPQRHHPDVAPGDGHQRRRRRRRELRLRLAHGRDRRPRVVRRRWRWCPGRR